MSVEHRPGEPQSVGNPEEFLALKDELLKAWERLPAEQQARMALVLLDSVREGEWGPWLREGVQTHWPVETAPEGHQRAEPTLDFDGWMERVDLVVWGTAGCSVYDLPDCAYYAMFEDGLLSNDAAEQALNEAGYGRR